MTGWRIIVATPAHPAPLARILGDWFREAGWMPILHSRAEDTAFLTTLIEGTRVRVAEDAAGALGFMAQDGPEIRALYLAPRGRGCGIGHALLAEAKATHSNLALWAFQANTRALAFYRREGFHEGQRTDGSGNEEGLPDVRMVWRTPG